MKTAWLLSGGMVSMQKKGLNLFAIEKIQKNTHNACLYKKAAQN